VLKKGVEVLSGPVSHLINRSLAKGKVPAQFKIGRVHPIHKGKGKPREDPALYRPVFILPALSKVMETHVKENLKDHLRKVNGLPGSQYGFRPKRPCSSALAQAQSGWLSGAAKGQVVSLMAFDLSAAFDTVAAEQLSPTLQALGVTGRELRWFLCYMTGRRQSVVRDGTVSSLINVLYGVRQGSILGPLLFIILVSGMAKFLGAEEGENIVHADDSNVWQMGNNIGEVVRKLTEKAAHFVEYTRSMGLSMNAAKDGGEGHRGRDVELLPQRQREGRRPEPRRVNLVHQQQEGHGEDDPVGQDRPDHNPTEGRQHLCHTRGPHVEQVGHTPPQAHESGSKEGGVRFGKSFTPFVKILPARLDLPPAACGVFPAGRGMSPEGRRASPRERRPSLSRSWAHHLLNNSLSQFQSPSFLRVFTPCSRERKKGFCCYEE
jgi:hypothetical protein